MVEEPLLLDTLTYKRDLKGKALPKKDTKRSRKELRRERQVRLQRAQEAYQIRREREAERKPKQWPKGKIAVGVCLLVLICVCYGVWQYYSELPPTIGDGTTNNPPTTGDGTTNNPPATGSAPNFSLKDINGKQFSLKQYGGNVIVIHFMAVGCHGQMYPINDQQLKQLKNICDAYCGIKPVTMITVAVSSCQTSDLVQIRTRYGITWIFGNDYDDGKMDIVNAYRAYSIDDGTIVLIDKTFNVVQVYTKAITADTLSLTIDHLIEG